MRNVCTITAFFLLLCAAPFCYGQNNKETAVSKAQQAIKLEDEEGKYDEAIKLFREAQGLDPENITYPYEIAYAYTGKMEYKTAEIPFGIAVGRTDMGIADKGENVRV
jgi:tetratricopeptide (TPR) repeat protein